MSARTHMIWQLARYVAASRLPHPLRVAIDGRTGAGKTTIADELVAPLEQLRRIVIRVEIDDFHNPLSVRRGRQDASPWQQYYRDSYHLDAIRRELLLPLGPGGNCRYRRAIFDSLHDTVIDEPPLLAAPGAVVLVDGVFLFRPELDDGWDVRIFIDVDAQHSLQRGPQRDRARVGSAKEAEARYQTTYIPGEDHYLASVETRRRADVVVDNRDPANPSLHFR